MQPNRSLVSPTSHPQLEHELSEMLRRRSQTGGHLGQLEPLALRLGLMQRTLKPQFNDPQLLVFAADHGIAVEGLYAADALQTDQLGADAAERPPAAVGLCQGAAAGAAGDRLRRGPPRCRPTT